MCATSLANTTNANCLLEEADYIGIVSHWDLDGLLSAAIVVKAVEKKGLRYTYRLSTHKRLLRSIEEVYSDDAIIVVSDLNPDIITIKGVVELVPKIRGIYWFDHHKWDKKVLKSLLKQEKVMLLLDENSITAEIVANYMKKYCNIDMPSYVTHLLRVARADDKNENINEDVRKWRIVLRKADWSMRYRILEAIIEGEYWPEWLENLYREVRKDYERKLEKTVLEAQRIILKCGYIAAIIKSPEDLNPSDVYNAIRGRIDADIFVITYGRGVSLRSEKIDVGRVAERLGGGGHSKAAGAPINEWRDIDTIVKVIEAAACS